MYSQMQMNYHLDFVRKKYDNSITLEKIIYIGATIVIGLPIIWILAIVWLLKYRNAELMLYNQFLNHSESSFRYPYTNGNRNFLYANRITFERKLQNRIKTKKVLFGILAVPVYGYVIVLLACICILPLIILYYLIHQPYRMIPKFNYYSNRPFTNQPIINQPFSNQPYQSGPIFQKNIHQKPYQQPYQQPYPQRQSLSYQTNELRQPGSEYKIKTIQCPNCQNQIQKTSIFCSECGYKLSKCAICKGPINNLDEIGRCPNCKGNYHLSHLSESIKVSGKCPVCKSELKEQEIETEIN